jgi:hypothetical protein
VKRRGMDQRRRRTVSSMMMPVAMPHREVSGAAGIAAKLAWSHSIRNSPAFQNGVHMNAASPVEAVAFGENGRLCGREMERLAKGCLGTGGVLSSAFMGSRTNGNPYAK